MDRPLAAPRQLVEGLLQVGDSYRDRPALRSSDRKLFMASRFAEWPASTFRFVVPDERLAEDLVDKAALGSSPEYIYADSSGDIAAYFTRDGTPGRIRRISATKPRSLLRTVWT